MGIEALLLSQVITISGSTGQVVTKQANGTLALQDAASAGISGSTGATDNAILRADGTGGATLQSSSATISDTGQLEVSATDISSPNFVVSFTHNNTNGSFPVRNVLRIDTTGTVSASSSTSLLWVGSYGTQRFRVTPSGAELAGTLVIDGISQSLRQTLFNNALSITVQVIRGAASQTANLTEWQNSAGSVVASMSAFGWLDAFLYVASGKVIYGQNGNITLTSHTGNGLFNLLRFGGATSASAAIKSNGAALSARLADDSANADFACRDITVRNLRMSAPTLVPASASATGEEGQIAWDADYVYVCVSTNTWKRTPLSTW